MGKYVPLTLFVVVTLCGCAPSSAPTGSGGSGSSVFPIDSGGEIEFPEGSIATSAKLKVAKADSPSLPLGVDAIGETLSISLDVLASRPMTLRLPAPEGVDLDQVSIFQVESNGDTTLLSTEVVDGFLVAATDHFTTPPTGAVDSTSLQTIDIEAIKAALGIRNETTSVPDISPPRNGRIVGPAFLQPGQSALYTLSEFDDVSGEALQIEWNLFGTATLALPTDTSDSTDDVVLFATRSSRVDATSAGRVDLTVSYVDPRSGMRGFASKAISIQDDESGGLVLSYLSGATDRVQGVEESGFFVGVLNRPSGLVTFEWDYGDGSATAIDSQDPADSLTVRTPSYSYEETGSFTAIVRATHDDGATGELEIPVTVRPLELELLVDGLGTATPATSAFDTHDYTIRIMNGTPEYQIDWELLPAIQNDSIMTSENEHVATLSFSEPGTYIFTAKVQDSFDGGLAGPLSKTAQYARPITVTGGNPLTMSFDADTTAADVDQIIGFTYAVSGGLLISNGQQQDYRFEIDWGDGEMSSLTLPSEGTKTTIQDAIAHEYKIAGTFEVDAKVIDATGDGVTQKATITVQDNSTPPDSGEPCGLSEWVFQFASIPGSGVPFTCGTADVLLSDSGTVGGPDTLIFYPMTVLFEEDLDNNDDPAPPITGGLPLDGFSFELTEANEELAFDNFKRLRLPDVITCPAPNDGSTSYMQHYDITLIDCSNRAVSKRSLSVKCCMEGDFGCGKCP